MEFLVLRDGNGSVVGVNMVILSMAHADDTISNDLESVKKTSTKKSLRLSKKKELILNKKSEERQRKEKEEQQKNENEKKDKDEGTVLHILQVFQ